MGYDTTLTDCLPGHLKNLQSLQTNPVDRVANPAVVVRRGVTVRSTQGRRRDGGDGDGELMKATESCW